MHFYLAPMAGVTDAPFRQTMRLFKTPQMITEMVAVEAVKRHHPATLRMLDVQEEKDAIVQLVGVCPESFVYAAQMAESKGAVGIDINMGCPVKKLISNGSGAALMKDPLQAVQIVEKISASVALPVSVKMRLGWETFPVCLENFIHDLIQAGAKRIAIHARTKEQGYAGKANWAAVTPLVQKFAVPIIINGDIKDISSAKEAVKITQSPHLMIGRASLGRPWLFEELITGKKPVLNLKEIVERHLDALLAYYGKKGIFIARKHIAWYAKEHPDKASFCREMFCQTDVLKLKLLIRNFF